MIYEGHDVVIVKNGRRLCGTGGALSNVPIIQNKAYFEIKIQANGIWGVGLATRKVDLNKIPFGNDTESWVLRNDGSIYFNNLIKYKSPETIDEGDVIVTILYGLFMKFRFEKFIFCKGVTYDHEILNFYLNGDNLETSITGIRGSVYPVFYGKCVCLSAILPLKKI